MATKRKTKKKSTHSKKTANRKVSASKTQAKKRKAPKKSAKRKAAPNKVAKNKATEKTKGLKKAIRTKTAGSGTQKKAQGREAFSRDTSGSRSAGQSGDLQGLSNIESADSESVEELLEEGNAFEAGVVTGVEDAGTSGVREVRTREVPEDDVPGEYLDKD
jgi:hypothetical protein